MPGSEKVMEAWRTRALSEDAVVEIAKQFDESRGAVEAAGVFGGEQATGVRVSVRYEGDDTPWCGNDIVFWLQWLRRHGGTPKPPRILINGTPFPDLIRLELDFGRVEAPIEQVQVGQF